MQLTFTLIDLPIIISIKETEMLSQLKKLKCIFAAMSGD